MNVIKTTTGLACTFVIVLFALIFSTENPEKKLFEKTVQSIMIHEGMSSHQELLDAFPELKDIKSKMKRIDSLNSSIHSMTGGPAPNVSKEESLQLQSHTQEIQQIRKSIKEELSQFSSIYSEVIASRTNKK